MFQYNNLCGIWIFNLDQFHERFLTWWNYICVSRYLRSYQDRLLLHRAMKKHQSQLVWFRRFYMFFSRYMLINSLQQMNLVDIELDLELDEWIWQLYWDLWNINVRKFIKDNIYWSPIFWSYLSVIALWVMSLRFSRD